jgi:hypothetical protein
MKRKTTMAKVAVKNLMWVAIENGTLYAKVSMTFCWGENGEELGANISI